MMNDVVSMLDSLILFRRIKKHKTFKKIVKFYKATDPDDKLVAYIAFLYHLIDMAEKNCFDGDILRKQILNVVISEENIYTKCCERGEITLNGTVNLLALNDMKIIFLILESIHDMFLLYPPRNIDDIESFLHHHDIMLNNYTPMNWVPTKKSKAISALLECDDYIDLYGKISQYIEHNGCNSFSEYETFTLEEDGKLKGISNEYHQTEDDIIGYENQKEKIRENTQRLLEGRPYHNVLLAGERGNGKSTLVKAQAKLFGDHRLRIIEVAWDNVKLIPNLLEDISQRGLYFIIFIDDVSFDAEDKNYKYFKSVVEGSIVSRPQNVAYYVTSNRRNLVKETFKCDDDKHESDARSSKISLKERFGIALQFEKMSPEQYFNTVSELCKINGINIPEDDLREMANNHELSNGRSGRSARQLMEMLK